MLVKLLELLLVCVVVTKVVGIDYCSIDTCAKGVHTLCKYPKDTIACPGDGVQAGLTDDLKKAILDRHNLHRQTVALGKQSPQPAASDMMQLTWNEEAALIAQRWANQCVLNPDNCRNLENAIVGQNLAEQSLSLTSPDVKATILKMIDGWYAQVKNFDPKGVKSFPSSDANGPVNTYTQLVWGKTTGVGCGFLKMAPVNKQYRNTHLICNYVPGGNIVGLPVYEEGKACSKCAKCSTSYPGLCTN